MADSAQSAILVEDRGVVRWITINRPQAANAIDDAVARGLIDGLREAASTPGIRAVVLTGAGPRVFSAGVDLRGRTGLSDDEIAESRRLRTHGSIDAVVGFEKPLVSALNGVTSGAGCMIALLTDYIVAAEHASLVLPEIDVGMPCFLGLEIVKRLAGEALAIDLVQSGRRLAPAEAVQHGLIRATVPAADLVAAAQSAAEMLAAKPALPFALNKRWLATGRREAIARAAEESHRVRPLLLADPETRTPHAARFQKS